jgi:uncharacterized protein (TIGR00255 family)
MTGFGRSEFLDKELEITSEVRSLNNRFLDISVRLPNNYMLYEQEVKGLIKKYLTRGRINLTVALKSTNGFRANNIKIDKDLLNSYFERLTEIKHLLQLPGAIEMGHLLGLPNIFTFEEEALAIDVIWEKMQTVIEASLQDLCNMREKEGTELTKDLHYRISLITNAIDQIERIAKGRIQNEFEKLNERIQNLVSSKELDAGRIEMEVAILADRIDVTEECTRFRSHNKMFLSTINDEEPGGRRLNFVTQEMNREVNTIGAKANDAEIVTLVIHIKEEIEKIREQVQNLE